MRAFYRYPAPIIMSALLLMTAPSAAGEQADDRYLTGYAAAILQMQFGLSEATLRVENGVLVLDPAILGGHDPQKVANALREAEGLVVRIADGGSNEEPSLPAAPAASAEDTDARTGWLPRKGVFAPVLADPRWPHFSASLHFYQDDDELATVASANVGASVPLYGWRALKGVWQVGLHAGVFSIFDLKSESSDLINADYLVGVPLTVRYGDKWSVQARLFHQSSHLGDEFLLRNRVERINLSYEALDLLISLDAHPWLRIYGGGGRIVRSDPDLDEYSVQGGVELTGEKLLLDKLLPVLALDVKASEEADWRADYSVRAGFELGDGLPEQRRLQFMLEYFNGRSPNGQFFERTIEYIGVGAHFHF